jgi:hypothetical protein
MNLPEEKISQISDWLLSGLPYHQVKKMIAEQFQITISLAELLSIGLCPGADRQASARRFDGR